VFLGRRKILHEAYHGIAVDLVDAEWQAFNLFSVLWAWPGESSETGMLVVEGSPALVNILTGILAVFLFERAVKHKPAMPYFLNQFSLFMNNS
jgi:hypothetical protein